jgi:hypothetical protein
MTIEQDDMRRIALLNGDCLAEQLKGAELPLEIVVFREALVSGPLGGATWEEFWETRVGFLTKQYGATALEVQEKTVAELDKIRSLADGTELSLWFEDDLFCQVNLWFVLNLLSESKNIKIYRVFPPEASPANRWRGFRDASAAALEQAYESKVPFTSSDLVLGKNLWEAYRLGDRAQLTALSKSASPCFRKLAKVCQAQLDRISEDPSERRPEKVIMELLAMGITDFDTLFYQFSEREGIYGFGDLQVRELMDNLIHSSKSLLNWSKE